MLNPLEVNVIKSTIYLQMTKQNIYVCLKIFIIKTWGEGKAQEKKKKTHENVNSLTVVTSGKESR